MRRGEATPRPKAEIETVDISPPLVRTVARLIALIGKLDAPGFQWRLWVSLALTLGGKVLAVLSPLVLADGVNALAKGDGHGAYGVFLGLAGFWAAMRFASTAGPQIRDAIFQPISEETKRRAGARVFAHVHALSVRFHSSKRTGAVYRTIERGAQRDRFSAALSRLQHRADRDRTCARGGRAGFSLWHSVCAGRGGDGLRLCLDYVRHHRMAPALSPRNE